MKDDNSALTPLKLIKKSSSMNALTESRDLLILIWNLKDATIPEFQEVSYLWQGLILNQFLSWYEIEYGCIFWYSNNLYGDYIGFSMTLK